VLVLTDTGSREAVLARAPQGWRVLSLAVENHGARVTLG
jgi:hypothetical protein